VVVVERWNAGFPRLLFAGLFDLNLNVRRSPKDEAFVVVPSTHMFCDLLNGIGEGIRNFDWLK
jgi:hypothetical protein